MEMGGGGLQTMMHFYSFFMLYASVSYLIWSFGCVCVCVRVCVCVCVCVYVYMYIHVSQLIFFRKACVFTVGQ